MFKCPKGQAACAVSGISQQVTLRTRALAPFVVFVTSRNRRCFSGLLYELNLFVFSNNFCKTTVRNRLQRKNPYVLSKFRKQKIVRLYVCVLLVKKTKKNLSFFPYSLPSPPPFCHICTTARVRLRVSNIVYVFAYVSPRPSVSFYDRLYVVIIFFFYRFLYEKKKKNQTRTDDEVRWVGRRIGEGGGRIVSNINAPVLPWIIMHNTSTRGPIEFSQSSTFDHKKRH